jgi:LysM repeat protein
VKKFTQTGALFLILVPLLTGCFQQAGEAFQPASTTAETPIIVPQDVTPTIEPDDSGTLPATDIPEQTPLPATDTVPETDSTPGIDMTIISPTRIIGGATATTADLLPTIETGGGVQSVETQTFRTPVSPLGPVTPDTPAPIASVGPGTSTPSGLITPTALPGIGSDTSAGGDCTYTIQRGETLFRIALANDTTVDAIAAANPGIDPNLIQPGQVIQLPDCAPGQSTVDTTSPTTAPDTVVNPPVGGGTTYIVERGDTLFSIAQQFGITIQNIVDANALANPNNLAVGQELIIPPPSP